VISSPVEPVVIVKVVYLFVWAFGLIIKIQTG
jgi:hypothetical protein